MSNDLVFGISFLSAIVIVAPIAAVVLMARLLANCFSSGMRASDRTRHAADAMVMRLVEKMTLEPREAARLHANERMVEARLDADTEREVIRAESPKRGDEPQGTSDDDLANPD